MKNNTEGAWYFNAAANEIIGTDVYDHLTGSGAQSLRCLLPIFDPDGVGQNQFPMRAQRSEINFFQTALAFEKKQ